MRRGGLVITGKTNTPEFGLPCYTETDGRAAGADAVGPRALGRRLAAGARRRRWRPGSRAPRHGLGRRRVDPHPGERHRSRRHQARARPRSATARCRDPVGELPTHGPLARTVRRRRGAARRARRPVPGRRADRAPAARTATRSSPPPTASPGRLRIGRYATPVIAEADVDPHVPRGLRGGLACCSSRSGTPSRTSRRRSDPRGRCPRSSRCGRSSPWLPVPPEDEQRLQPAHPLAARARPGVSGHPARAAGHHDAS